MKSMPTWLFVRLLALVAMGKVIKFRRASLIFSNALANLGMGIRRRAVRARRRYQPGMVGRFRAGLLRTSRKCVRVGGRSPDLVGLG